MLAALHLLQTNELKCVSKILVPEHMFAALHLLANIRARMCQQHFSIRAYARSTSPSCKHISSNVSSIFHCQNICSQHFTFLQTLNEFKCFSNTSVPEYMLAALHLLQTYELKCVSNTLVSEHMLAALHLPANI